MKKIVCFLALLLSLVTLSSCGKDTFYSGEAVLDGTIVRYLVSEEEHSLKITAEGARPATMIFVKLMDIQASTLTESEIDRISAVPHEHRHSLEQGKEYCLFLEKNGRSIGIGQFKL